jgi:hypothetical protein
MKYQLTSKIITYVKDESTNLNTFAFAFTSVVFCAPLQLVAPFTGTCFGHDMSKACQYATNDTKIGVGMKEMCSKSSKCLVENHYMDKELGKGRQEWESTCKEIGLRLWKLKTLVKTQFASKVVFFQEKLEYVATINFCYS